MTQASATIPENILRVHHGKVKTHNSIPVQKLNFNYLNLTSEKNKI